MGYDVLSNICHTTCLWYRINLHVVTLRHQFNHFFCFKEATINFIIVICNEYKILSDSIAVKSCKCIDWNSERISYKINKSGLDCWEKWQYSKCAQQVLLNKSYENICVSSNLYQSVSFIWSLLWTLFIVIDKFHLKTN